MPPPTREDTGLPQPRGEFPIPVLRTERCWDRAGYGNKGLIQGLGGGIRRGSETLRAPAAAGTAAGRSVPARAYGFAQWPPQ